MFNLQESVAPYWSQFVAVISASLALVSAGMEYGWTSPAVPVLRAAGAAPHAPYWLETLYIVGGVCGLPVTLVLLARVGRRRSLLLAAATSATCWLLLAVGTTTGSFPTLLVARFISGMSANVVFVGLPMYTAEIASPQVRGFLGSIVYTMSIAGTLVAYSVVPWVPLWASSILGTCLGCAMIATFFWQPESPYFLLLRGCTEEAEKSLCRLRCSSDVSSELQELSVAIARQTAERGRPQDLVLVASNRKATLVMTLLNTAQNMTGVTALTMNLQSLLEAGASTAAAAGQQAASNAILYAATMLVSSICGSVLIDRVGRKVLLVTSSVLTAGFLAILGAYFLMKDVLEMDVVSTVPWVPLFSVTGYAFAFKLGLGLVPIVVTAELFPAGVRALGMVLADLWFTGMATVSLQLYHYSAAAWGLHAPLLVFSGVGLLAAVLVAVYVPETRGRTLEQVQMILKGLPLNGTSTMDNTDETASQEHKQEDCTTKM